MRGEGDQATDLTATFYALYEREAVAVLRYLRSMVRDHALAEDLCADAFCRAWDAWRRFRGSDVEARAWVMRIARNLATDAVRRDGRVRFSPLTPDRAAAPPTGMDPGLMDLRRAMARLERDDRDLLAMRVAGLSHAEIARVLGKSEEAVKKAWQRALTRVREQLEVPV